MSGKKIAKEQPDQFEFSLDNKKIIEKLLLKYPEDRKKSAVMPLLYLAQRQNNNWIPLAALRLISNILNMSYIKVYEVATFYTMYNLSPVGKYFVQVCTTTPCMIKGSGKIVDMCKKHISSKQGELNKELNSSWTEVECLGACISAPMAQINEDYYEDLNVKQFENIIKDILKDIKPKPGSYRGRINSEPEKNRKTLLETKNA